METKTGLDQISQASPEFSWEPCFDLFAKVMVVAAKWPNVKSKTPLWELPECH